MLLSIDDDEKVVTNGYTPSGNQKQWFLTEDGLYEVLMQSRKPIAKSFKKEVKKILKELRVKGYLSSPASKSLALLPDDVPITAFTLTLDLLLNNASDYLGINYIGTRNRSINLFSDFCYLYSKNTEILERVYANKEVTFITKFVFSKNEE